MADNEKAELYRRIVETTPESVLLERMRLHGFWHPREGLPTDPPAEAAERARIDAELAELRRRHAAVKDVAAALTEERRRRWEESKARRAARKLERARLAAERRAAWDAERAAGLVHAGEGVSAGLHDFAGDDARLAERGLPVVHNSAELAAALGLTLSRLRWLTYHRRGATLVHYRRYEVRKKTGGVRCISAPKPALAAAQRWVLDNVLARVAVHPAAHGFVPGRSLVSNAAQHVGRRFVFNLDLRDFFPSVTFRRVKGLFHKLGYCEHVATVLALLCTEPPRVPAELDGKVYYVALGERVLPQGACTSPAVTNSVCRRLDCRLTGLAARHGCTYTRYADDLTFSGDDARAVGRRLRSVRAIVAAEGFVEHPTKTKVMRAARRQEVTGVTVNSKPAVDRREVRLLRAVLHNAARHGLESQNRDGRPDFLAHLRGRVEFVCMVDPARGRPLKEALRRLMPGERPV